MSRTAKIVLSILITIAILVAGTSLVLPAYITHVLIKTIDENPDYQGHIGRVNLSLLQGGITLNDFQIQKRAPSQSPFFKAQQIAIKLQWAALLHRSFVAEITIYQPILYLSVNKKGETEELDKTQSWQKTFQDLYRISINKMTVQNGEIHFITRQNKQPFDFYCKNITVELTNLSNAKNQQQPLFAKLRARGITMDGAPISLFVEFNPLAPQLTFNMDAEVKNMNLPKLNPLLINVTKLKVTSGEFNLYVEAAAAKNKIRGYVKPLVKHLEVATPPEEQANPVKQLYKGAAQVLSKVLENPQQKTIATKVPIHGNINNPDASTWATVITILRHAFIQALLPQLDHTIDFKSVLINT